MRSQVHSLRAAHPSPAPARTCGSYPLSSPSSTSGRSRRNRCRMPPAWAGAGEQRVEQRVWNNVCGREAPAAPLQAISCRTAQLLAQAPPCAAIPSMLQQGAPIPHLRALSHQPNHHSHPQHPPGQSCSSKLARLSSLRLGEGSGSRTVRRVGMRCSLAASGPCTAAGALLGSRAMPTLPPPLPPWELASR